MINRTLLRTKAVQLLYAFQTSKDTKSIAVVESEIVSSLQKTYELYYQLLKLSVELTRCAEERIEMGRNKFRPTPEERNPNMRFVNNLFIRQLDEKLLEIEKEKKYVSIWRDCPDVLKRIFEELILPLPAYTEYMEKKENEFNEDKNIWKKIYSEIPDFDPFYELIEEKNIYWADDVDMVSSFVIKTIKRTKEENNLFLVDLEDEEDFLFIKKLLIEAIENYDENKSYIEKVIKNWDSERIAFMDMIIMILAISEILNFPTIPVNVTLNEFIDIAKLYSTEKSGAFINGVLDKVVNLLKTERNFIKVEYVR